jgi:hypothetical protein
MMNSSPLSGVTRLMVRRIHSAFMSGRYVFISRGASGFVTRFAVLSQ